MKEIKQYTGYIVPYTLYIQFCIALVFVNQQNLCLNIQQCNKNKFEWKGYNPKCISDEFISI